MLIYHWDHLTCLGISQANFLILGYPILAWEQNRFWQTRDSDISVNRTYYHHEHWAHVPWLLVTRDAATGFIHPCAWLPGLTVAAGGHTSLCAPSLNLNTCSRRRSSVTDTDSPPMLAFPQPDCHSHWQGSNSYTLLPLRPPPAAWIGSIGHLMLEDCLPLVQEGVRYGGSGVAVIEIGAPCSGYFV